MRIFALQTDIGQVKKEFITPDESILNTGHYHWFLFIVRSIRSLLLSAVLIVIIFIAWRYDLLLGWVAFFALMIWILFALFPLISAYIDWKFDFLLITNEKLVVVTQGSLFKREIRQMNLDNVASVSSQTQLWNIFSFGTVCIDLKEGTGQRFCLSYIRNSAKVSSDVSDAVMEFQRRRAYLQKKAEKDSQAANGTS